MAAKGTRVKNSVSNLWLATVVAATVALHPAPVAAAVNDLSEERTDGGTVLRDPAGAPYRGVLGAAQDSESGISGASDASDDVSSEKGSSIDKASETSEDGSPKEDVAEKPKKKKKRSS